MKVFSCLLFLCFSLSLGQFNKEIPKPDVQSFSPVIFEAIPCWGDDTSSVELIVLYRINPRFFFFAKTNISQQETYLAKGDLVVEILDDKDGTTARDFKPIQIQQNSLPTESNLPIDDIQGTFTFKLKKGVYKIVVEAKDSESGKSFINRDSKVDAKTFFPSGLNFSPVIFIEQPTTDLATSSQKAFFPLNRGGNIIIGEKSNCLFQVALEDTITELKLLWKLTSKEEEEPFALNGEHFFQQIGTLSTTSDEKRISLTINKGSAHNRILIVPIPTERLETGKYQLTISVTQGVIKSEKEFSFNVIWPLKPQSLSNFRNAIEALCHIATKEELNQMNVFSSVKSIKAFREFWKKRSPDTTRAFNPALAEYYRRVDETIKRFSTENERDGYLTDRGRIYILFGSPTRTNRLLKPNAAPTEIWTYEKLKRRFTFSDQRKSGNYILIKTENY